MIKSPQTQSSLCYILHSFAYQDNSLILQCLSLERGIISFLSKGARSSKKNLLSLLQPFQLLLISYVGKSDLLLLTGVELYQLESTYLENNNLEKKAFEQNKGLNGKSIYCAYYVNELYLRLLSTGEENTQFFALYQKTIESLHEKDKLEITLRRFEISLLEILGYQPNLEYDIHSGQEISTNKNYYYDVLSGPYEVDPYISKPNSTNHSSTKANAKVLVISGQTLLAIKSLDFNCLQTLAESKKLLRQLLLCQLGEKPLKSREVYRQLYRHE